LEPGLIFALGFVVVIALLVGTYLTEKRRRERIHELCTANGWQFTHRDRALPSRFRGHFPVFDRGFGRECRNIVVAGDDDGDWYSLFDYTYKERRGTGKDRKTVTYRYAVAVTPLPVALPTLRIDAENVLSRLASAVGFAGIEVESADFNRRFRVTTADRAHAFDILHPRTIDFLLTQRLDNWEIAGGYLMVLTRGRWRIEDYAPTLDHLRRFRGLVPDYVWRKHGHEVQQ
jgi:hypothetical protein